MDRTSADHPRRGIEMIAGRMLDLGRSVAGRLARSLQTETVRLAVTGLSRAGKTVFITSMIHNLLAQGRGLRALPALVDRGLADRLAGAAVMPAAAEAVPRFDFQAHLAALAAATPAWPPRTADISQVSLRLSLDRAGSLGGTLAGALAGRREVILEILDYPGEWLLDLPLLEQSFAEWSASTLAAARQGVRAGLSDEFLSIAGAIDPDAAADDATPRRAHDAYRRYLEACRARHGLRFLQPGRFLCPGPWGDLPLMWFCPLPVPVGRRPTPGSLPALMEARYDAYRADVRAKFVEPYLQRFDRQIVLVDVLGALHAGEQAFADTRRALAEIARSFRYGRRGPVGRLFGSRIDRVMFAATKADHVPERQREALQLLLERMVEPEPGACVALQALASIRCTTDDTSEIDGRMVQVVSGLPIGRDRAIKFYPGEVPLRPPPPDFWTGGFFELPIFQPPRIHADGAAGIPHLGLDEALAFLIGDRL